MERKINLPIYILTFILTVIIFAIGFWFGTVYDSMMSENIELQISEVSYQLLSMQLFYLTGESVEYCDFYKSELDKIDSTTAQLGYELTFLEETKGYTNPELKDKYFVLETTSLSVNRKISEICGSEDKEVLYFYSNEKCGEDCIIQGRELLKLKENKNVRIYSFDCTIDSPIANSLCKKYNVKSYPTIVTNENIFVGLHKYNELLEKI
jgi:hypothetical protein